MAFCTRCGARLPDGARFCTNCGAPLQQAAAPQQPPPQAYQPAWQQPVAPAPQAARPTSRQAVPPKTSKPKKKRGGCAFIFIILLLIGGYFVYNWWNEPVGGLEDLPPDVEVNYHPSILPEAD